MKMPWGARTIDMKHLPPKIPAAHSLMWLTMAHYWDIPQWGWITLFVVIGLVWINWLGWFAFHEAVDFDVKVIESVVQNSDRPRTEVMQWAKQPKAK